MTGAVETTPMRRSGMSRKQRRLIWIAAIGLVLAAATALTLMALSSYINVFRTPSMVIDEKIGSGISFRLGGMVERGSHQRGEGTTGSFVVVDCKQNITVRYNQILPDLFREGQHVVTEGALDANGRFVATNVLARHDENYIPREVADEMRKQGHNLDSMSCEPAQNAKAAS
jgi:cytochrome c-type biogenesis protein CcmE